MKRKSIMFIGTSLVVLLIIVAYPLALVPENGGGGGEIYPPPDPDPDPDPDDWGPIDYLPPTSPTLNQIYPDPDPDGSITISWTKPVGTIGFELYRSKNGGAYSLVTQTWSTLHIDRNLDNGDYSYKVRAYNNYGDSDYSNVVSVTVGIPDVEPPPPTEPVQFVIPPIYYILLIGGLGVVSFLVYKKTRRS